MKTDKLFHVSTTPNLKKLEPRVSTHGKSYVYATKCLELALFFGGRESAGDFDGPLGISNGIPYFCEAYKGAFKRLFDGAECYIYEVDPSTFVEGKTTFSAEIVSENPVKVLSCKKVENLYDYLLQLNSQSKIDLHFYEDTKECKEMIDNHISDRLTRFGILERPESGIYKFCEEHFPEIVKRLNKEVERK